MQIMALKQSIKGRKRALREGFHESRAVSRLRLQRVRSGEWPERAGRERGGWESQVSISTLVNAGYQRLVLIRAIDKYPL